MPSFLPPTIAGFLVRFSGTADQAISNSNTETSLMPATGTGSKVIEAGWLKPGRTVRCILRGTYSSATLPGNLTFRVKLGGSTIATAVVTTLATLGNGLGFVINCTFTCRSVTGGQADLALAGDVGISAGAGARPYYDLIATGVTVDATVALPVDITAQFASLLAANGLAVKTATLEFLEQ